MIAPPGLSHMNLRSLVEGEIAGSSRKVWVIGIENLSVSRQMRH